MATRMGLEPTTSAVTGRRSNQLSYQAIVLCLPGLLSETNSIIAKRKPFVKSFFEKTRKGRVARDTEQIKVAVSPFLCYHTGEFDHGGKREPMKKLLLFDCFGVVMREVAPFWFRRYYSDEEADRIKESMMHDGDVGAVPDDVLYRRLGVTVGVPGDEIKREWEDLVIPNPDTVALIRELKTRYRVALLSNAMSGYLRYALDKCGIADLFDFVIVSAEVKLVKPDPAIFELALERAGVVAKDALMIDDVEKNLDGAKAVGIDGYLFRSAAGLRDYLARDTQ